MMCLACSLSVRTARTTVSALSSRDLIRGFGASSSKLPTKACVLPTFVIDAAASPKTAGDEASSRMDELNSAPKKDQHKTGSEYPWTLFLSNALVAAVAGSVVLLVTDCFIRPQFHYHSVEADVKHYIQLASDEIASARSSASHRDCTAALTHLKVAEGFVSDAHARLATLSRDNLRTELLASLGKTDCIDHLHACIEYHRGCLYLCSDPKQALRHLEDALAHLFRAHSSSNSALQYSQNDACAVSIKLAALPSILQQAICAMTLYELLDDQWSEHAVKDFWSVQLNNNLAHVLFARGQDADALKRLHSVVTDTEAFIAPLIPVILLSPAESLDLGSMLNPTSECNPSDFVRKIIKVGFQDADDLLRHADNKTWAEWEKNILTSGENLPGALVACSLDRVKMMLRKRVTAHMNRILFSALPMSAPPTPALQQVIALLDILEAMTTKPSDVEHTSLFVLLDRHWLNDVDNSRILTALVACLLSFAGDPALSHSIRKEALDVATDCMQKICDNKSDTNDLHMLIANYFVARILALKGDTVGTQNKLRTIVDAAAGSTAAGRLGATHETLPPRYTSFAIEASWLLAVSPHVSQPDACVALRVSSRVLSQVSASTRLVAVDEDVRAYVSSGITPTAAPKDNSCVELLNWWKPLSGLPNQAVTRVPVDAHNIENAIKRVKAIAPRFVT
jgi:hypothetical protein